MTPKPHFHVGQRIVCVDGSPNPAYPEKLLTAGKIYTVRAIDRGGAKPWKGPGWGVHLMGVIIYYPRTDNKVQWAFHPDRFRPIVERRPTNIKVFEDIAAGLHEVLLPEDGWL